MEINANISEILREMITFLECLRDAQLPLALESLREKLLDRTKNTMLATTMNCSSPEPYLDMNSGPRTILLTKKKTDTEEYIGMEESPQKQNHQDYYETFEPKEMMPVTIKHTESQKAWSEQDYGENSQVLMSIYKNLSAAQCKNNSHKCGPLHWKNGKIFSERRPYYVALIGTHLLIYRSEQHSGPCNIYSIRGCIARSNLSPNLSPRNGQKSKSAFEICCPGSKTLQFIARTPKDMEQWTAKICEVGCNNEGAKIDEETNHGSKSNASSESPMNHCKDHAMSPLHQNAHKLADNVKKKSTAKGEAKNNRNEAEKNMIENPPPLPARIPRRILPSVPSNDSMPSYRGTEDYDDDDDTYYKIEDLQNGLAYQNITLAKKQHVNVGDKEDREVVEYDDVHASKRKKEEQVHEGKSDKIFIEEEMYDDIFTLSRVKTNIEEETSKNGDCSDDGEESFYDDVENLLEKSTKERVKDQIEASSKILQKRSFLERVWNKKESSGKTDKRLWGKASSSPIQSSSATKVIPTYDDVSDLMPNQESLTNNEEQELSEYNYPPPPRPVCTKSSFIINQIDPNPVEELYDDVSACRTRHNNHQQMVMQSMQESCTNLKEIKNEETELRARGNLIEEEIEHYQSPKSDLRVDDIPEYQNEELYDDIALCANFKARQRDINEKKDDEYGKFTVGSDKKSWNRFSMNKKWRLGEPACLSETNKRNINECEDIDDSTEVNDITKRNTFQKLISKMENSLAKVSVRNSTSLPMSKSTANNNS
ncbi:PREDICTED: uncharacterized protein LOC106748302 [Dinoponera quadriceps]|uniref:Uncharacterized protein LOC106748302 n=1 Tax=Dinoponera quadriceps TaxID=609295 RepID=A0A6P3XVQ5_DINQU|nr:PREDICTED: uncharacterized protein LOC106748302 [Dinoponera quadriceps]